jgi:hypothetical protein
VSAELDLSGRWIGIFNYPSRLPPEQFEAELRETGGLITGLTSEPSGHTGVILTAVLEGTRHDTAATFTKRYDDYEEMPHKVLYTGTVAADGNEIEGRWEISPAWSGSFIMIREGKAQAEEERAVGESIDAR